MGSQKVTGQIDTSKRVVSIKCPKCKADHDVVFEPTQAWQEICCGGGDMCFVDIEVTESLALHSTTQAIFVVPMFLEDIEFMNRILPALAEMGRSKQGVKRLARVMKTLLQVEHDAHERD